jgi:hypothetical protein
VSNPEGSIEVDLREERSKLSEGLQNCRSVLESYRVMLAGQNDGDPAELPEAFNDNAQ